LETVATKPLSKDDDDDDDDIGVGDAVTDERRDRLPECE
jgi:hypothetical protein